MNFKIIFQRKSIKTDLFPSKKILSGLIVIKMLLNRIIPRTITSVPSSGLHTTAVCNEIRKMTRLRVVDNCDIGKKAMAEGKPPRVIHVYNKKMVGYTGDMVLMAIKGEKKKGILVGCKQQQKTKVPRFDTNNVVLIDDNGTPLGTRYSVNFN